MESKNNKNESVLCGNCKAFFGTIDTNFLCSKCYKENQKSQASNNLSAERSVFSNNQLSQPTIPEQLMPNLEFSSQIQPSSSLSQFNELGINGEEPQKTKDFQVEEVKLIEDVQMKEEEKQVQVRIQ